MLFVLDTLTSTECLGEMFLIHLCLLVLLRAKWQQGFLGIVLSSALTSSVRQGDMDSK